MGGQRHPHQPHDPCGGGGGQVYVRGGSGSSFCLIFLFLVFFGILGIFFFVGRGNSDPEYIDQVQLFKTEKTLDLVKELPHMMDEVGEKYSGEYKNDLEHIRIRLEKMGTKKHFDKKLDEQTTHTDEEISKAAEDVKAVLLKEIRGQGWRTRTKLDKLIALLEKKHKPCKPCMVNSCKPHSRPKPKKPLCKTKRCFDYWRNRQ